MQKKYKFFRLYLKIIPFLKLIYSILILQIYYIFIKIFNLFFLENIKIKYMYINKQIYKLFLHYILKNMSLINLL